LHSYRLKDRLRCDLAVPQESSLVPAQKIRNKEYPREENFVKNTILAVLVVLAFTLAVSAQEKKPPMALRSGGTTGAASPIQNSGASFVPPTLCGSCFFYGGDINPISPNADGFSDENTLLIVGGSATYGAVIMPFQAALQGMVFNILASAAFDPKAANYDIRENITDDGGISVQNGSSTIQIQATGRNAFGFTEYAIAIHFPTVTLEPGVEYWFNVEPQCLNGAQDGSCYVGRFYASNSQGANNIRGTAQPQSEVYFNSNFFGVSFENWCTQGLTPGECDLLSFGLIGTPN